MVHGRRKDGAVNSSLPSLCLLLALLCGCGKSRVDQALDSDANGYLCRACQAKFYTERSVFANNCPACKSPNIAQVVGFVCAADNHTTVAPRGIGFLACEKCGKATSALSIPREADLRAWGAAKKTQHEVGGS